MQSYQNWLIALIVPLMPQISLGAMVEDITVLSPKAIALANAVTASPPDLDAIHFNPAGLDRKRVALMELKLGTFNQKTYARTGEQIVDPDVLALYESLSGDSYPQDPLENKQDSNSDIIVLLPGGRVEELPVPVVPLGGFTLVDRQSGIAFGSAVYSPMMVGMKRNEDSIGRYQGLETAVSRITYFSPTLSVKVSDDLAIGLGINFSYQGVALRTHLRTPQAFNSIVPIILQPVVGGEMGPGPYDDLATMDYVLQDNLSVGFNAGLLWDVEPWLTLGLSYRSATKSNLKGEYRIDYTEKMVNLTSTLIAVFPDISGKAIQEGKATMDFVTPQNIALGISVLLIEGLRFNFDVKKANYSDWDSFDVSFDQPIDLLIVASLADEDASANELKLQRKYQDSTSYAFGVEYAINSQFALRCGYEQRGSSIPKESLDLTMPISDSQLYGLGFKYDLGKSTFVEFGIGYLKTQFKLGYDESSNANSEDPYDVLYNPYVYLPFQSKTTSYQLAVSYIRPF